MIPRFLERKLRRSACALSSRDGPQSGPGSYRSVSSLARQEAPGYSANPAFRACGSAAKVTANPPPVRARTGHAAGRALKAPGQCPGGKLACAGSVAGLAKPASCLRQGRKGPRETSAADVHQRSDQARASARRSKARIAQREHPPRRDSGGTPPRIAQREHPLKKDPLRGPFLRVDYSTRFRPWSRMTGFASLPMIHW